jgi:hypothetical protein
MDYPTGSPNGRSRLESSSGCLASPRPLIGEVREPIPADPDQPERYDCQYRHDGAVNPSVFLDAHRPLAPCEDDRSANRAGFCHMHARSRRYPLSACGPEPCRDGQSFDSHRRSRITPAPEAHRILQRLEFHYTHKHASWLNMVEIARQCLDQRIGDRAALNTEVAAWRHQRRLPKNLP